MYYIHLLLLTSYKLILVSMTASPWFLCLCCNLTCKKKLRFHINQDRDPIPILIKVMVIEKEFNERSRMYKCLIGQVLLLEIDQINAALPTFELRKLNRDHDDWLEIHSQKHVISTCIIHRDIDLKGNSEYEWFQTKQ